MLFLTNEQSQQIEYIASIIGDFYEVKELKPCSAETFTSFAYELNNNYICRFPRSEKGYGKLKKEYEVLQFIQGKTTLPVPCTCVNEKDYMFCAHQKIIGDNLTQTQLSALPEARQNKFCEDIARFISELNRLTPEISKHLNLPHWSRFDNIMQPQELGAFLAQNTGLDKEEKAFVAGFLKNFKLENEWKTIRFSHFDLMGKNMAFDFSRQQLAGIYDFGDSALGDVYQDFNQIGQDFDLRTLQKMAEYYEVMSQIALHIEKVRGYSIYEWLVFYFKYQSPIVLQQLKEKLRQWMSE